MELLLNPIADEWSALATQASAFIEHTMNSFLLLPRLANAPVLGFLKLTVLATEADLSPARGDAKAVRSKVLSLNSSAVEAVKSGRPTFWKEKVGKKHACAMRRKNGCKEDCKGGRTRKQHILVVAIVILDVEDRFLAHNFARADDTSVPNALQSMHI